MAKNFKKQAREQTSAAAGEMPNGAAPRVRIVTTAGEIVVELYPDKAPISVKNFLDYVNDGFYNGTVFHRVIKNFMIQCGGMDANLNEKANKRSPIKNEAQNGLKNEKGTLAMARTSEIHSATSQFFINLKNNSFLDHGERDFGYAVFGKVISGIDVVEKIGAVKTGANDVPQTAIVIEKAEVVQ